jgi:hypothetical protein
MEKDFPSKWTLKQPKVAILISAKTDFKPK